MNGAVVDLGSEIRHRLPGQCRDDDDDSLSGNEVTRLVCHARHQHLAQDSRRPRRSRHNCARCGTKQPVKYTAFYSSQLGGVVTDPALMVIPFDDHMVHRGHGIFDTAGIVNGKIYDLDAHLDRFLKSAERSKLKLPGTRAEMRDIIIRTTAASGRKDGSIRYWLSSGTGSLDLTPVAGADPGLLRDDLRGPRLSGEVEDRRRARHDDDLPDQAAALRDHQDDELPAQRADADGSEGKGLRQRRVHRSRRPRRRELEHERRVRESRQRARASEVRSHPVGLHVAAPARARAEAGEERSAEGRQGHRRHA